MSAQRAMYKPTGLALKLLQEAMANNPESDSDEDNEGGNGGAAKDAAGDAAEAAAGGGDAVDAAGAGAAVDGKPDDAAAPGGAVAKSEPGAAAGASDAAAKGSGEGKDDAATAIKTEDGAAAAAAAAGGASTGSAAGPAVGDAAAAGSASVDAASAGATPAGAAPGANAAGAAAAAAPVAKKKKRKAAAVRTFQLREANEHIICVLCGGYFIDATTIIECLHTFCKSCLVKHFLNTANSCPTCEVLVHETDPFSMIRQDVTIQTIVFKICKDLEAEEAKREDEWYAANPQYRRPNMPAKKSIEPPQPAQPRPKKSKKDADEQISFVLEKEDETNTKMVEEEEEEEDVDEKVQKLEKPYIRTSARATILHLKKFLKKKLELASPDDVDILCQGQIMGKEYTLEYIRKTSWRSETEQLKLVYRQKVNYEDMGAA